MSSPRVYISLPPEPRMDGPYGTMQYDVIVTANTKDEAAAVAGLHARELVWERDTSWHPIAALGRAGMLGEPGRLFVTGAGRKSGDEARTVWLMAGDGWELLGTVRPGGPPGLASPYLDSEGG